MGRLGEAIQVLVRCVSVPGIVMKRDKMYARYCGIAAVALRCRRGEVRARRRGAKSN